MKLLNSTPKAAIDEDNYNIIFDSYSDITVTATDFAVCLFNQCLEKGKNTLISPLSILYALSMTANGADNETLAQMEAAFGVAAQNLNEYLHEYMNSLPADDKYRLNLANSIWINDDSNFHINQNFLSTNAKYYNSGIYITPFDAGTKQKINDWVRKNTDNMIDNILDETPQSILMYLINALAFTAEWDNIYYGNQVRSAVFTRENGTKVTTDMMYSTEYAYLKSESAQGFIKHYRDGKYAFAALLPDKSISIKKYAESLNGKNIHEMLKIPKDIDVETAIPKFETTCAIKMNDILINMGMTNAFDAGKADFSRLGGYEKDSLFISEVLHKTFITVNEQGTKAGAATSAAIARCAIMPSYKTKKVYLDRPFLYMIIDCKYNFPIFIGAVVDI